MHISCIVYRNMYHIVYCVSQYVLYWIVIQDTKCKYICKWRAISCVYSLYRCVWYLQAAVLPSPGQHLQQRRSELVQAQEVGEHHTVHSCQLAPTCEHTTTQSEEATRSSSFIFQSFPTCSYTDSTSLLSYWNHVSNSNRQCWRRCWDRTNMLMIKLFKEPY